MNTNTADIKDLLAQHNLTEDEFKKIVDIMGREPNLTELGMFSVMWSEHCSYKAGASEEAAYDRTACRTGPGENAGAVDIGDGLCVVLRWSRTTTPSFIEPYQGAATGVGGILRDVFTMGARPIALLDSLRFGSLDSAKNRHIMRVLLRALPVMGTAWEFQLSAAKYAGDHLLLNPLVNAFCLGVAHRIRSSAAPLRGSGIR